jgi:hypothetical protein
MKSKGNNAMSETLRPNAVRQPVPFPQRRQKPEEHEDIDSVDSNENRGFTQARPRLNNVVPFHRPMKRRPQDGVL